MLGDQGVRLYEKPNSPFKFYDFTFKGKRYRAAPKRKPNGLP